MRRIGSVVLGLALGVTMISHSPAAAIQCTWAGRTAGPPTKLEWNGWWSTGAQETFVEVKGDWTASNFNTAYGTVPADSSWYAFQFGVTTNPVWVRGRLIYRDANMMNRELPSNTVGPI